MLGHQCSAAQFVVEQSAYRSHMTASAQLLETYVMLANIMQEGYPHQLLDLRGMQLLQPAQG